VLNNNFIIGIIIAVYFRNKNIFIMLNIRMMSIYKIIPFCGINSLYNIPLIIITYHIS